MPFLFHVPTTVAMAFDPNHTSVNLTLSNNNLTVYFQTPVANNILTYSTLGKASGKWYCELTYDISDSDYLTFGVVESDHSVETDSWAGDTALSYGIYAADGEVYNDGNNSAYGSVITQGDILMMALNMDDGEIYWGLNGTWFSSGNPATQTNPAFTGLSGEKFVAVSLFSVDTQITVNFGATTFTYTPPSGFTGF
jgi:hypothetical protein